MGILILIVIRWVLWFIELFSLGIFLFFKVKIVLGWVFDGIVNFVLLLIVFIFK